MPQKWVLNTSNRGKAEEFLRLFAQHGIALSIRDSDLDEIDADPVTVVVHKASQLDEKIFVEDTSLDIEGASVGIHIRWFLEHLPSYLNRRAEWRTLLAYREKEIIHIYEGKIKGMIVSPRGESGFGFDPFFLPDNSQKTLAEAKPDSVNARAKAVEALMNGLPTMSLPRISSWSGSWQ